MKMSLMRALSYVARRRMLAFAVLLGTVAGMLPQIAPAGAAHAATVPAFNPGAAITTSGQPDFGPNVYIFDPSMSTSQIQTTVDGIAKQQVDNEMGPQRYALLFKPGVYGTKANPLDFQVGYYTEVAGLGASPTDVTINGHVDVYNRCLANNGASNCIALDNFWRSLSNLTINVTGLSGCRGSGDFWAVSQAAPMRRVNITGGNLTLFDYCTAGPQQASGGFIADTQILSSTVNGSQQQFLVRDSTLGGWSNGVWNQVFSGVQGAPAQSFSTTPYNPQPYTTLPASPVSREKPFLYADASGHYSVFVPALRHNAVGTTWANGPAAGSSIPIERFYIARPADTAFTINMALARGRNLIFTPGIYHLNRTIRLRRPDTVVLGLGFATLTPDNGIVPLMVPNVKGVKIASLLFDAGPVNSPILLQMGSQRAENGQAGGHDDGNAKSGENGQAGERNNWSNPADPSSIQDVFFRIGGASLGKATTSLVVNSDNVLLDDIWAWRADHGTGVGWTSNTADTGVRPVRRALPEV